MSKRRHAIRCTLSPRNKLCPYFDIWIELANTRPPVGGCGLFAVKGRRLADQGMGEARDHLDKVDLAGGTRLLIEATEMGLNGFG